jgi:hypothetical protein
MFSGMEAAVMHSCPAGLTLPPMAEPDAFETWVRTSLARYGVEADETDVAIMRIVEQVYGPPRDALLAADLSGIPPEFGLDPSRSPFED